MKGPEIRRDALNPNNITTEYMLKNSRNTQQDGNLKRERERERIKIYMTDASCLKGWSKS